MKITIEVTDNDLKIIMGWAKAFNTAGSLIETVSLCSDPEIRKEADWVMKEFDIIGPVLNSIKDQVTTNGK